MGFKRSNFNFLAKIFLFYVILISVIVSVSYVLIRSTSLTQIKNDLNAEDTIISRDLKYSNGKWDTSLYNSDPLTAYPNSSSPNPLYIITSDGFVIERSKPISGLLDTSNFAKLLDFKEPFTISVETNESWRVLSSTIERNGEVYGVTMVSYYNPDSQILDKIDAKLKEAIETINSKLTVNDFGSIDASKMDIRNVHYDVSFEIVDRFNKVVLNNGRTPSFIDSSYVSNQLKNAGNATVEDAVTHEQFLISTFPILDDNKHPIGMVVNGQSVAYLNDVLQYYLLSITPISLALIPLLTYLTQSILRGQMRTLNKIEEERKIHKEKPKFIAFNKKEGILNIDGNEIHIPYDSNQYYLCKLLFSNPSKRWEMDEIREKMGETQEGSGRKIYDTCIAINKKANAKLVIYQDKTCRLNPDFLESIS